MARTRTREAQLIITSITLFTLIWFTLFLHPSTFFLFTSLTDPSEINRNMDDEPLATMLLNMGLEATNPFLPPLINPHDEIVRKLTRQNFSDFLLKNKSVMVAFYSPNCFWSRKIVPEYAAAAADLIGEEVKFAAVDSRAETDLAAEYGGQSYLAVYLFVGGDMSEPYDYSMATNSDAIVSWVKLQIHGRVHNLMNQFEAKSILADNSTSTTVLAILDSLEGQDRDELVAASRLQTKSTIYITNILEVANVFYVNPRIQRPGLAIIEKETKRYISFEGRFTRWEICNFLSVNMIPLVMKFTKENAQFISDSPQDQLWLSALKGDSERVLASFRDTAKYYRGQFLFVYVEMDSSFDAERELPHGFGTIAVKSEPAVIAYSPINHAKEVLTDGFNTTGIKAFAEAFLKSTSSRAS